MINEKRFEEILNGFKNIKNIGVLGDVGVDKYTSGDVERISPEAPVPVLEVEREWTKLGLAANVSDNLIDLGINSTLCGVIGNDSRAEVFEELLENRHLSTWGIVRSKERPTTFKERIVAKTQQICRIDYESKNPVDQKSKSFLLDRLKEFSSDFDAVIVEDYAKGLLDEGFSQEVIKLLKEQGKMIAVDPSRNNPAIWYKGAYLLKPNFVEATLLVEQLGFRGEKDRSKICEILLDKLDLDNVVVTLGAEGMVSMTKKEGAMKHIPTIARDVYDVSGAGDTSIAVLTASLVSGANLEEAMWMSNLAAGVVVGKKGTATVTINELRDYYVQVSK